MSLRLFNVLLHCMHLITANIHQDLNMFKVLRRLKSFIGCGLNEIETGSKNTSGTTQTIILNSITQPHVCHQWSRIFRKFSVFT